MFEKISKGRKRSKKEQVEALIDPAAETATSVSELGIVGHGPIDAPLYSAGMIETPTEPSPEAPLSAEEVAAAAEATPTPEVPTGWESAGGPVDQTEAAPKSFDQVLAEISEEQIEDVVLKTAAAFDDRSDFERLQDPDNANIHRTLKKARTQMVTKRAAKVMIACSVSPDVINRSIHEGARYNVYAIGKLADVIFGVTDGAVSNAINLACMRSLFQLKRAGKGPFTGEIAKACASDKLRSEAINALKAHLVRHTVSASTAPTQASSTMQALVTLGVVTRSGTRNAMTFELTEHPIVSKLESLLAAAA